MHISLSHYFLDIDNNSQKVLKIDIQKVSKQIFADGHGHCRKILLDFCTYASMRDALPAPFLFQVLPLSCLPCYSRYHLYCSPCYISSLATYCTSSICLLSSLRPNNNTIFVCFCCSPSDCVAYPNTNRSYPAGWGCSQFTSTGGLFEPCRPLPLWVHIIVKLLFLALALQFSHTTDSC